MEFEFGARMEQQQYKRKNKNFLCKRILPYLVLTIALLSYTTASILYGVLEGTINTGVSLFYAGVAI